MSSFNTPTQLINKPKVDTLQIEIKIAKAAKFKTSTRYKHFLSKMLY